MWGEAGGAAELRGRLNRMASVIRQVAGMPDYEAHLEHLRRCHPERPVPTEREFFEQWVQARYREGGSRCC
jgi:uncharacterized short protein YbdD (DUF466 family)